MHIPGVSDAWNEFNKKIDAGKQNKGVAVRASLESIRAVPQGLLLGVGNYQFSKMMKDGMNNPEIRNKMTPEQLKMQGNNVPMPLSRSIGGMLALFSVQRAAEEVVSHFRKERDTWNAVIPAACGGLAFGVVSAQPGTNPLTMAIGFAGFTALIDRFSGAGGANPQEAKREADARYEQSQFMLTKLGLEKYHRKLKNGLLTDDTIMLWNDSVLTECKIPPGPRLLILDHLEHVKSDQKTWKKTT